MRDALDDCRVATYYVTKVGLTSDIHSIHFLSAHCTRRLQHRLIACREGRLDPGHKFIPFMSARCTPRLPEAPARALLWRLSLHTFTADAIRCDVHCVRSLHLQSTDAEATECALSMSSQSSAIKELCAHCDQLLTTALFAIASITDSQNVFGTQSVLATKSQTQRARARNSASAFKHSLRTNLIA